MFGMSNPEQVVSQFERYAQEDRLEIAEVMSAELIEKLINEKINDIEKQKLLIKAIRSNASILLRRGKFKQCKNSSLLLKKQIKKINNMARKSKLQEFRDSEPSDIANDHIILGSAEIGLRNYFRAKKSLNEANKLRPCDVEICVLMLEAAISLKGKLGHSKSSYKKLIKSFNSCGPVILENNEFILRPEGYIARNVNQLVSRINEICNHHSINKNYKIEIKRFIENIENQINEIKEGLRAANLELARAIETLDIKTDYYSY